MDLTPFLDAAFSIAAAEPESIGAMMRTFAPSAMHWSACVFCFCGSPCALTTRAETPAALNALISDGLSNCSHRTDVFVSGIRPQAWMPALFFPALAVAAAATMAAIPAATKIARKTLCMLPLSVIGSSRRNDRPQAAKHYNRREIRSRDRVLLGGAAPLVAGGRGQVAADVGAGDELQPRVGL